MSWHDRYTTSHWDHERDLRKHDPRPGDKDYIPDRLSPPIATALEVAVLVRGLKDVREGAKLVEQYAQTVAAAARLDGVVMASDRILATLDGGSDAKA
jgi:hypothetical protein